MSTIQTEASQVNPVATEPTEEDEADFARWGARIDAERWGFFVAEPGEPTLPFDEWIACQASYYRSQGSEAGSWLAARIDLLAEQARFLDARGPAQFDDRHAAHMDAIEARR